MSIFVLTDCTTWCAGYDFTTDLNSVSLSLEVDEQDSTTFGGNGYRSRLAGLKNVDCQLDGFWQSGTTDAVDPQAFTQLGTTDQVVTMSPTGAAASTAYMFQGAKFGYEMFGSVGETVPFSLSMMGTNTVGVVRGQIAAAKQSKNSTGVLGSVLTDLSSNDQVSSSQYLYAVLHVFSAGTTITVQVQSDDSAGMASPTTRGTIGPVTTAGGTWMTRVAGPITDTHYRLSVSAITGTFSVAGAIAIQ